MSASSVGPTNYKVKLVQLSDASNIQVALNNIVYGTDSYPSDSSSISADSLYGNLANKVSPTFSGNVTLPSTTTIMASNGTDVLVSSTELSYLDGVTSNIQTQIDGFLKIDSFWFGDGSDGDVTITSPTTLTRDMYYDNLTLSGSARLNPDGFRIFVKTNLDLTNAPAGAIANIESDGSDALGTAPGAGGTGISSTRNFAYYGRSSNGGSGGSGQGGSSGDVAPEVLASSPIFLGNWIQATGGGALGALTPRTAATASTTAVPWRRTFVDLYAPFIASSGRLYGGAGGLGGNGAGKDSFQQLPGGGGGGGGSGNTGAFIYAKKITVGASTADSAILFRGGAGGNGDAYEINVGGGGGGGQGGIVYLVYREKDGTMSTDRYLVNTSGGTGGTGYRGGQGGASGSIAMTNLGTGVMTVYPATAGSTSSTSTGGVAASNKRNLI